MQDARKSSLVKNQLDNDCAFTDRSGAMRQHHYMTDLTAPCLRELKYRQNISSHLTCSASVTSVGLPTYYKIGFSFYLCFFIWSLLFKENNHK